MISGLKVALQRIYNTIPMDILRIAFKNYDTSVSMDDSIHKKVLVARVLDDASVRGGTILRFLLDSDWLHYVSSPSPYALGMSGSYSMYHVPASARDHRDIATILQVRFPYSIGSNTSGTMYHDCSSRGNSLGGLACSALNAQTGAGLVSSPAGIINPGNIIRLEPPQFNYIPWQITCRLKFDEQFSQLDVSSIQPFALLCEHAVKAYIYTHAIVEVETNVMYRGMELGVVREIINSYSDANEKYDEQLLQFGGAQQLEPDRLRILLSRMVR